MVMGRHSAPLATLLIVPTAFGVSNAASQPITVGANCPNAVSFWNDIADQTVMATSTVNSTPAE